MRAVVLCHTSELALVVLRALRANGVVPFVICERRIEKVLASSRACERVLLAGDLARNKEDIAAAIDCLNADVGVDVVMASNVQGLRILHEIRDLLAQRIYPMPPMAALDVLDDKRRFQSLARRLGLRVPKSLDFESGPDIDVGRVTREIGYPAAVKPAISWASIGFRRIASEREMAGLTKDPSYPYRCLIVQEYVEGEDAGAGVFVRSGRVEAMTTFKCGPRDAAEFVLIPDLAASAERIVLETGCEGVVNFDARIDPSGQVCLLECNPRFFMRLRALRFCGLDLLRLGLPDFKGDAGAASGRYRPLGDVASTGGFRQLLTGDWAVDVLARTAAEVASDPMPTLLGRLGSGRTYRPPAER